ncbi:MAG: type II toxin-antitoxin system RelE/ParE family toxin [Phycisphaerae bacterium]|nr:type II toxin-antitoxin system RelE/ParE family toxin [Phycisphaerae bacterium]
MMWEVEFTDEYERWWQRLTEEEHESILIGIKLLREMGPLLGRPYADTVNGSRHSNMKELRTQHQGKPLRSLFAFDPRRRAILLIGGDKTGNKRFYKQMITKADQLFDEHLEILRKEGLL